MFAFAVKRVGGFHSAIALWMGSWGLIGLWQGGKKLFVATRDPCGHIRPTAIADLNIVLIAYLEEPMMFRKMLRDKV